ncbi:MAG: hypothetical protein ICV72_03070 [Aldersonia sp.]|nr:hypothetical protein [Aldersonia sp.]
MAALLKTIGVTGMVAVGMLLGSATAAAAPPVPVDERPCRNVPSNQCPFSVSEDGLTWCFHGNCSNYDKYGSYVCSYGFGVDPFSDQVCRVAMDVIRALPPVPIGAYLPGP